MSIAALTMIFWGVMSAILMVLQAIFSRELLASATRRVRFYLIFFLSFALHAVAIVISAIGAAFIKGKHGDGFFVASLIAFYFIACLIGMYFQQPKKAIDRFLSFTLPLSAAFNSSVVFARSWGKP